MTEKTVWQCDENGKLIGIIELSEAGGDFGRDGWLIPAGCVEIEPPKAIDGYCSKWSGTIWELEKTEISSEEKERENPKINLRERLNEEYSKEKSELLEAFLTAQIHDDLAVQYEIRNELKEVEIGYATKSLLIDLGENPWVMEEST